jgi:PPK2 family polyphosphate:nucleotide phosphotransferase
MRADQEELHNLQRMMYAGDKHALLIIFQAMDAAGKDSTIRAVFSNMFPQAGLVQSFKAPTTHELDQDYLWRHQAALPQRGRFSVFNRSYYEEVLVTRVHPGYIVGQRIPGIDQESDIKPNFWKARFKSIRDHEQHLAENGTVILKFFLNVGKEEQKRRFLERINNPDKNWKFSHGDLKERGLWPKYQHAYEEAIRNTSAIHAPWFVIPADNKWFMRMAVSNIIVNRLKNLGLSYPELSIAEVEALQGAADMLNNEK